MAEPQDRELIVETAVGAVRGRSLGPHQNAFLGIPYAEAPTGDLRFEAPVPHEPWVGVRDATRHGATPLRDYMTGMTLIPEPSHPGEETLNLNVFAPQDASGAQFPVFVWIHGGGFTSGSAASPWYEGGAFPRDGVIVVTVSYRLGLDGFGVIDGAPNNRGVRDWLLALAWVRDNIAAFGGDPARVTIGGQSAGGSAVLTLLSMPEAHALFASAIVESPGASTGVCSEVALNVSRVARELGIAPTRDDFAAVPERNIFEAQSRVATHELTLGRVRKIMNGASSMDWTPVVDGDLLHYSIEEAFEYGIGADKPLLIGANAGEADGLLDSAPKLLDAVPRTLALHAAGLGRRASAYSRLTHGHTRRILGAAATDAVFRFTVARALAARDGSTYAYDFRLPSTLNGLTSHCMELPFVWDCLDAENVVSANTGPNPPQSLADEMHAAWVRMITEGHPPWPVFAPDSDRVGRRFDRHPETCEVFARELDLVAH